MNTYDCKLCHKCRDPKCDGYCQPPAASAGYSAGGKGTSGCIHENYGWCTFNHRCKSATRMHKKGPRGGTIKTNFYACERAL